MLHAQRFLLYALDELAMAALRMRIRMPGEAVKPHEAHFKLHEEEVPVKNKARRCSTLIVPPLHQKHQAKQHEAACKTHFKSMAPPCM